MTSELGMNLAGVERVFELEDKLRADGAQGARLERRAEELQDEIERLEEIRRTVKAELVLYEPRTTALVPVSVRSSRRPREVDGRARQADALG
jgi:MerR family transcriptional regulator/heat shock protein HspR